ncbi:hypothetical protein PGB90_004659 [Kerria lacca]
MAEELQVNLQPIHICAVHRLPVAQSKIPNITAKLNDNDKKIKLVRQAKITRLSINSTSIYISDRLIPCEAALLREAKNFSKKAVIKIHLG